MNCKHCHSGFGDLDNLVLCPDCGKSLIHMSLTLDFKVYLKALCMQFGRRVLRDKRLTIYIEELSGGNAEKIAMAQTILDKGLIYYFEDPAGFLFFDTYQIDLLRETVDAHVVDALLYALNYVEVNTLIPIRIRRYWSEIPIEAQSSWYYKWGQMDLFGDLVTPFVFDSKRYFSTHRLYEPDYPVLLREEEITDLDYLGHNVFKVLNPMVAPYNKLEVYNTEGECVLKGRYDDIYPFHKDIAIVKLRDKYGVVNQSLQEVHPCTYDSITLTRALVYVVVQDGKVGVMNLAGEVIVPLIYEDIITFTAEVFAAQKHGQWGFISKTHEVVLPFEYDRGACVGGNDGLFLLQKDGKWGVLDADAEMVVPFEYDDHQGFTYGFIYLKKGDFWGVLNSEGEQVVPFKYDAITVFMFGVMTIEKGGKVGLVSIHGDELIPCEYDSLGSYLNGLISAEKDGQWGFINLRNEVVIPFDFDKVRDFTEGMAVVLKGRKHGLYSAMGEELLPCRYDQITVHGTVAEYKLDTKLMKEMGYMNNLGQEITPFILIESNSLKHGIKISERGDKEDIVKISMIKA